MPIRQRRETQHAKKQPAEIWAELIAKIPWEKTPEHTTRRKSMFRAFDINGNGYLSLAEVDLGIKQVLRCEALFNSKPVLIRAFSIARNLKGESHQRTGADYVEFKEFRALLWYLRQYLEYWKMFARIDTSHDRRVSFIEFQQALEEIKVWGVEVLDAKRTFRELDKDGHGMILFDEFCHWAIINHLDLEDDDDAEDVSLQAKLEHSQQHQHQYSRAAHHTPRSSSHPLPPEAKHHSNRHPQKLHGGQPRPSPYPQRDRSETQHARKQEAFVWAELAAKLPWKKTRQDRLRRKAMYQSFDINNNGYLSLAEVDRGIKSVLRCEELFNPRPVLRAFSAARNLGGDQQGQITLELPLYP